MGVKLKKIQRINPLDRTLAKWYLTQEKTGTVGITEIAKRIAAQSSLSLGDVQSVLSNMVEIFPVFLKLGQTIRIEGFGTFHIVISSEGVAQKEELSAHNIKALKLRFLPGNDLKRSLKDISFEIVESKDSPHDSEGTSLLSEPKRKKAQNPVS